MIPHYVPKTHRKIAAIVLALIIAVLSAVSAYIGIYLPSPTHSMQLIARAMQDGNEKIFSEMVDEKSLSGQIFDALAARATHTKGPQPLVQLALEPLREDFQENSQTLLTQAVAKKTDSLEYTTAATALDGQLHSFGCPLDTSNWHYVSTGHVRDIDDHTVHIDITMHNDRIDADLTCTLVMEKIDKNRWRITGVHDFEAFLSSIDKAVTKKLTELNKPAQNKIDAAVRTGDITSRLIRDESTGTAKTLLRVQYNLNFPSSHEAVEKIEARYELRRHPEEEPSYTAKITLSNIPEKDPRLSRTVQFLMNPLVPSQYALIQQKSLDSYTSKIQITAIYFKNGTVLKTAAALPE